MKYILGEAPFSPLKTMCAANARQAGTSGESGEEVSEKPNPNGRQRQKRRMQRKKKNRRVLAASEPNREIREAGLPVSGSTGSTWLFNWEGGLESLLELDGSSVPHCNRLPSCFSQSMLLQLTVTPPRK